VHELVIIETGHIDARFKHEVWQHFWLIFGSKNTQFIHIFCPKFM